MSLFDALGSSARNVMGQSENTKNANKETGLKKIEEDAQTEQSFNREVENQFEATARSTNSKQGMQVAYTIPTDKGIGEMENSPETMYEGAHRESR